MKLYHLLANPHCYSSRIVVVAAAVVVVERATTINTTVLFLATGYYTEGIYTYTRSPMRSLGRGALGCTAGVEIPAPWTVLILVLFIVLEIPLMP